MDHSPLALLKELSDAHGAPGSVHAGDCDDAGVLLLALVKRLDAKTAKALTP